jgi:O-antigen ligase
MSIPLVILLTLVFLAVTAWVMRRPSFALAFLFDGWVVYFYLINFTKLASTTWLTAALLGYLILATAMGGLVLLIKQRKNLMLGWGDLLFAGLFIWFVVNGLWLAKDLNYFLDKKLAYAIPFSILPFFVSQLLGQTEIRKFIKYAVLVPAVTAPFLLIDFLRHGSSYSARYFVGESSPILVGMTFGIVIIILLVRFGTRRSRGKIERFIKYVALIIFLILIFVSGGRAPIVSLVITLIIYFLFFAPLPQKKALPKKAFIVLLLSVIVIVIIPKPTDLLFHYQASLNANFKYNPFGERATDFVNAINLFYQHPLIGVGVSNYYFVHYGPAGEYLFYTEYPHNIILESAATMGIIGLILLSAFLYLTIARAWRFIKKQQENSEVGLLMKTMFLLFIFIFIQTMVSGTLSVETNLFIVCGLIWALIKSERQRPNLLSS